VIGLDVNRKNEIYSIFEHIDEDEKELIGPLIEQVLFLEQRMSELQKLPFLKINPKNPMMQKVTPAAKLYKECMQSYMNAIRILLNTLRKVESSAADELLEHLKEFTLDE
jgi:hypothetical protein